MLLWLLIVYFFPVSAVRLLQHCVLPTITMMPLALLKPSADLDKPSSPLGLLSSGPGLNLESRVLAQASEVLLGPCMAPALQHSCASPSWATAAGSAALQPTWLSSTAASSPLLSPELLLNSPQHLFSHAQPPGLLSSSVLRASDETCVLLRPTSSSSVHLAPVAAESVVDEEEGGGGGREELPIINEDLKCATEVYSGVYLILSLYFLQMHMYFLITS